MTASPTKTAEEKRYVIVRTYSAGVFAGFLERLEDRTATLTDARRLWHWEGAATLSQLAQEGTSNPEQCKFPVAVSRVTLFEVIEIDEVSPGAAKSIQEVPIWRV